jgi:putative phage-type endonuclease
MSAALRISTAEMPHEEWLQLRRQGIGGSDAAAVLGLNPYKTNFALWEEKVGAREPDDLSENEAVHWGNVLEEPVAQEFARRTGRKVRRVNALLRHPEHPFMIANLDREVVAEDDGKPEILECKTAGHWAANSEQWGPSGTDLVPKPYLVQAMHYLAVTGRTRAHVAALIGGQELRLYTVERNEELIAAMIERERAFWKMVETRTAPTIIDIADAKRAFPVSLEGEIDCLGHSDVFDAALQLREQTRLRKAADDRIKSLQGVIGGFMGERDTLTRLGDRLLTWKTQSRKGYTVPESTARIMRLAGEK